MADVLVSIVLERLTSVAEQQIHEQVSLVQGVKSEIQSLKKTLRSVQDVLEDAEKRQVKEKSVRGWLENLKDMAYEMEDVLDEWSIAILQFQTEGVENASTSKKKVSFCMPSPCICFKQVASRRDIALKIKGIKQQLDDIERERIRFNFVSSGSEERPKRLITTSAIDISEVCGRDVDEKIILDHLLGKKRQEKSGLYIVAIVGTGGMGKTTLARLAYHHPEVEFHFDERIWVCVSDPFDPFRVFRAIVEALQKKPCKLHDLQAVQEEIRTRIAEKKFLLVLDDVWTEDNQLWEQLKNTLLCGAAGSRILATTRKESVVMMMRTTYKHPLGELSSEQSRALFHQIAFYERSTWEKEEELKEIDSVIVRAELIKLWMAQSYLKSDGSKEMEMVGRTYFEYLAARSFFQDFEKDDDAFKSRVLEVSPNLFRHLTCLRALDLSSNLLIEELPKEYFDHQSKSRMRRAMRNHGQIVAATFGALSEVQMMQAIYHFKAQEVNNPMLQTVRDSELKRRSCSHYKSVTLKCCGISLLLREFRSTLYSKVFLLLTMHEPCREKGAGNFKVEANFAAW
ncbi:putative disease resistance protein RGA4 [Vitis vinifera]|uniref:Putative disease resistance protein RGA4 n=1 Tax=Vitis vinifera TaxID=29760 RepID=A0A438HFB7_VITVI|nr:putative disease resistance protein RGA4 [Vitis vinifera]